MRLWPTRRLRRGSEHLVLCPVPALAYFHRRHLQQDLCLLLGVFFARYTHDPTRGSNGAVGEGLRKQGRSNRRLPRGDCVSVSKQARLQQCLRVQMPRAVTRFAFMVYG